MTMMDRDSKRQSLSIKKLPLTSKETGSVRIMVLWRRHVLLVWVEIPAISVRILS